MVAVTPSAAGAFRWIASIVFRSVALATTTCGHHMCGIRRARTRTPLSTHARAPTLTAAPGHTAFMPISSGFQQPEELNFGDRSVRLRTGRVHNTPVDTLRH